MRRCGGCYWRGTRWGQAPVGGRSRLPTSCTCRAPRRTGPRATSAARPRSMSRGSARRALRAFWITASSTKMRRPRAQRQRDRVGRTRVDVTRPVLRAQVDRRVEGVVLELAHHDALDRAAELVDHALQQVVGHRPRRLRRSRSAARWRWPRRRPPRSGSMRSPSVSRRTMMGMLVMGSIISPLMRHLDLHGPPPPLAQNIGAAELTVNESVAKACPAASSGRERVISTLTVCPTRRVRPVEVDDAEVRACGRRRGRLRRRSRPGPRPARPRSACVAAPLPLLLVVVQRPGAGASSRPRARRRRAGARSCRVAAST